MNRIVAGILCLWAFVCFGMNGLQNGGAEPAAGGPKEIEAYLKTAPIVAVQKDATTGRTMPWKITLDDGKSKRKAMFKRINAPWPNPMVDSYKYELAAYELSKFLGLDFVPPTVEREIEGVKGSLQYFVPDCMSETDRERLHLQPPDLKAYLGKLDEIKVFEALVNDECLDKDDTLIQQPGWKVYRVDFAEAFAPRAGLSADCPINRCPRRLFERLQKATRQVAEGWLKGYLSDDEIGALCERKKKIVARLGGLINTEGERNVLY
jgi:hypothetical protein